MTVNTRPTSDTTGVIINTLQDFINWYSENITPSDNSGFYRGHADHRWSLEPAVYRNQEYRVNESRLYNELLCSAAAEFKDDDTLLERLARMQHYGLPTRLLDLTTNPLVALYFSCADEDKNTINTNGKVMLFHVSDGETFYPKSLPEVSFAGVVKMFDFHQYFNIMIALITIDVLEHLTLFESKCETLFTVLKDEGHQDLIEKAYSTIDFLKKNIQIWDGSLTSFDQSIKHLNTYVNEFTYLFNHWFGVVAGHKVSCYLNNLETISSVIALDELKVICSNAISSHYKLSMTAIEHLCENFRVKNEKIYSSVSNYLNELQKYHFVCPSMNNERLRRQHGAFLVCPPYPAEQIVPVKEAIIPCAKKADFLKDLEKIGISRSQLFPELNVKADELKKRFGPKSKHVGTVVSTLDTIGSV